MIRTILALAILFVSAAASAQNARPSMPYFGTAKMNTDESLTLRLDRTADGKPVDSTLTFTPTDRAYDSVRRHLRGIAPGQTRPLTPWKD
ncbi:hypothetical protein V1282_001628 [Nitrobacteraceae bacterium AZCC 2146]